MLNPHYDERYEKNLVPFLDHYTTSPVDAAYDLFDHELWWGQRQAIRGIWKSMYNMVIAARGTGKTRLLALCAVLRATMLSSENVVCTASSFRQAKLIFQEIERIYESSPIFRASCKKAPVREPDMCKLNLSNGSSISALPLGDGGKIRGVRAHTLLIDEVAQIPVEIIDDVLMPMLNAEKDPMQNVRRRELERKMNAAGVVNDLEALRSHHCIIMASTAYFRFNHLYKRYTDWMREMRGGDERYSVFTYTYLDPPPGFINYEQLEMEKKSQPIIKFMMEHLSVFPDEDASAFFPPHMVDKMRSTMCPVLLDGKEGGIYVIAVDPARTSDNFTIGVFKLEKDMIKLVFLKAFNNVSYTYTAIFLRQLVSLYDPALISMDRGGGGYAIYDELNKTISLDYIEKNIPANDKYIKPEKVFDLGPIDLSSNRYSEDISEDLKNGRRFLIDLVTFTPEWNAESNFKLRSKMMTTEPSLIVPAAVPDEAYSGDNAELYDDVLEEVSALIDEVQNIRIMPSRGGASMQFVARDKKLKRDRYTALLIGNRACVDLVAASERESQAPDPDHLADGFWL